MSELNNHLWKTLKNSLEPLPSVDAVQKQALAELKSKYPVRTLGQTADGPLMLREEQRESHMHILGAPGQGKSKLLEMLIREDIKNGFGACLLDPSDNGDTMYKVLAWCVDQGFDKVVIIDPHDIKYSEEGLKRKSVPSIAPRHNLMETVRILFNTKDASETPVIEKYLPAVFHALSHAEMTLAELVYFTDRNNYKTRRVQILEKMHDLDRHKVDLETVFNQAPGLFNTSFGSTVRRLEPFLERRMTSMFGLRTGIPFTKLITDGWLILCNLDYQGVGTEFDNRHQRLIGTAVINEIFYAISSLRSKGWQKFFYLYIDEVGDYATRNISTILDKKRKSGLRLTVAHQRFSQLEDQYVRDAVLTGTGTKVLFQTSNPDDVVKMAKMMYGGDLPAGKVEYVLRQLAKQNASVKVEKEPAVFTKLKNIREAKATRKEVEEFKQKIYNRDEWYHSPEEVKQQIDARFKSTEVHTKPTKFKGRNIAKPKGSDNQVPRSGADLDGEALGPTAPSGQAGSEAETPFDNEARQRKGNGISGSVSARPEDVKPHGKGRGRKKT